MMIKQSLRPEASVAPVLQRGDGANEAGGPDGGSADDAGRTFTGVLDGRGARSVGGLPSKPRQLLRLPLGGGLVTGTLPGASGACAADRGHRVRRRCLRSRN